MSNYVRIIFDLVRKFIFEEFDLLGNIRPLVTVLRKTMSSSW